MSLRWQIDPAVVRARMMGARHRAANLQVRVMAASHAWAAPRWTALSIITGSIESTCHPSEKAARISSWVTRRGPNPPGCRSLKHSRKYLPPGDHSP